jgi:hypothetical protein
MRICLSAATKKTPWPSQSMSGLLEHCAARPLPNAEYLRLSASGTVCESSTDQPVRAGPQRRGAERAEPLPETIVL